MIAAALLLALAPAGLDTPAYTACLDRAGGVTVAMHACMETEYSLWDARLNASYRRLMTSLPAERAARLRSEERAWLRRRDAKCAHAGDDNAGGSLQGVEQHDFDVSTTQARAAALERREGR